MADETASVTGEVAGSADSFTLYDKAGREYVTTDRIEATNLRSAGYTSKPPFDPAAHNVAEVQAHLDTAPPAEATRVVETEKRGKARATIVRNEGDGEQPSA